MPSDSLAKLGIIAGRGPLPIQVAEACVSLDRPFFVIGIEGEASTRIAAFPHAWVKLGEVGRALETLRREACEELVLIGPVRRPDLGRLGLDWEGAKLTPRLAMAARKGDDALLSTVVGLCEEWGFRVVGAEHVARGLRAPAGPLGRRDADASQLRDIRLANEVIQALGPLDVGQAAVACDGHVIAIEAAEGTAAMLSRCAGLPQTLRGSENDRRGVLVKRAKPGQERRVDLPLVGPDTVTQAAAAGLAGIAVEADGALILEKEEVVRRADALGLFVIGFDPAALSPHSGPS